MYPFALALRACIVAAAFLFGMASLRSGDDPRPAETLSAEEKMEAVDHLVGFLRSSYVFPEVGESMSAAILERQAQGGYESIHDAAVFARTLTDELQAISHDKHMRVRVEGGVAQGPRARPRFPATEEDFRRQNFGFEKVQRLPGNIGYVDLRMFAPASLAGDTVAAALDFVANTEALILDLRENGGGQPDMVQLFCSYFFDAEPVHLNDLYFRPSGETRQFWTLPWLRGKRYLEKDVYVLTSHDTFSGAEECAYDLKTQQRARIVGETTGGGANPGGSMELSRHLSAFVPTGRAINPVTKTNWEGTGVVPDVQVPAGVALATARKLALEKLVADCRDADRREALAGALDEVQRELAVRGTGLLEEPSTGLKK